MIRLITYNALPGFSGRASFCIPLVCAAYDLLRIGELLPEVVRADRGTESPAATRNCRSWEASKAAFYLLTPVARGSCPS